MPEYNIYSIDKNFQAFNQLERLFKQFYEGMEEQGLLLPIEEHGEKIWIDSVKLRLGKLAAVYVAELSNELIGFSSGYIKFLPAFLGSNKVGFIDGIYVLPDYRKSGLAEDLCQVLEKWLQIQKAHSIELQVLIGNIRGVRFWDKMGYNTELYQMRKMLQ